MLMKEYISLFENDDLSFQEYYHKLSLELYRTYKNKLAMTAFKSMKAFKTAITEQREIKFTVII